jgi:hypothetical protein
VTLANCTRTIFPAPDLLAATSTAGRKKPASR